MRGIKNREKGKWKRLVVFLILLSIFAILLNSIKNVYIKKKIAQKTLVRMEKEASELEKRNKFLKELLEKLTTKEGLEFEMRERLNVAKIGENVAIIVEEKPLATASQTAISPWQKLKNFLSELFK